MLGMVCELPTACSSWLKPEQASTRNRELYGGQTCQTSNKSAQKHGLLAHARTLNPPTPAFAKAGAAPGTTAGVELFRAGFKCARQLPPSLAVSLCCSRVAAWPFACTSLAAASTKFLAVSVPALQPALCLHIAFSC